MGRVLLYEEMNQLRRELAIMAARVEEDLEKAIAVLHSGGEELAEEIKESGKIVDKLQIKIEDMALALIATQQPVARDLRELIAVFKITSNLGRIGDYGIHLVKAALRLSKMPPFRSVERIERMVKTAVLMLKEAISAYLSQNSDAARKAAAHDDIIDQEHKALTDEVLLFIKEQPRSVKSAARLLRLSGYMERLGDHITNICEGIIYMIEGSHEELND
ncbi:MAG: phosphate signaling complex protein PhoU [Treponema sp.]|jgi:phosphate transport system protein|nr:phosphate signaling complex protein PhoU [Treponema sp.]